MFRGSILTQEWVGCCLLKRSELLYSLLIWTQWFKTWRVLGNLWNKSQDLQLVYTLYCLSTRFCLAWCKFAIIATNSTTLYASLNNSRKLISRKCGNKTGQLRVQIKACMCSLSEGQIQTVSFHCIFLWVFVKCIYDVCQEVDVRR